MYDFIPEFSDLEKLFGLHHPFFDKTIHAVFPKEFLEKMREQDPMPMIDEFMKLYENFSRTPEQEEQLIMMREIIEEVVDPAFMDEVMHHAFIAKATCNNRAMRYATPRNYQIGRLEGPRSSAV